MRKSLPPNLEAGRERTGYFASDPVDGPMGAFLIKGPGPKPCAIRILSSGVDLQNGWEHVSVSLAYRAPNWTEMAFVKDLFWEPEECVLQFHPPRSLYINAHPFCLHLWRPLNFSVPLPPPELLA